MKLEKNKRWYLRSTDTKSDNMISHALIDMAHESEEEASAEPSSIALEHGKRVMAYSVPQNILQKILSNAEINSLQVFCKFENQGHVLELDEDAVRFMFMIAREKQKHATSTHKAAQEAYALVIEREFRKQLQKALGEGKKKIEIIPLVMSYREKGREGIINVSFLKEIDKVVYKSIRSSFPDIKVIGAKSRLWAILEK
ncbi:MAG: hypothetical protein KA052_03515 [Candidatus Pacebacteria bacterium]|jgi:hypothetical protein|nr:hypothetical protein [Candidatus Paceibacterota bacterium]